MKVLDILAEYFNYFIDGLSYVIKYIYLNFPIPAGILLFILGIKMYMNLLEKDPIDYNSKSSAQEKWSRGNLLENLIYVILLGIILIISNV